jgi:molybdate transport system substrate-binding protein
MHMSDWMRAALLVVSVSAHGAACADEIRVAVAANFAAVLEDLAARFEASSGHEVLISSGSTGGHYAQIHNGAPFDVFFAADAARPALLEQEGRIVAESRFTYAVGRLALWSTEPGYVDADGKVLAAAGFRFLAIANPELAPYGAAARDVLEGLGLWERLQDRLVQGQDIGQTLSFVYTRSAELGFVAYSQLRNPDRPIEGSHWLVPAALHQPIEQQAVLLEDTPAAREFLEFVKSEQGRDLIRSYGYGP